MQLNKIKKKQFIKLIINSIIALILSFTITVVYLGRQFLIDQLNVLNFKPSDGIVELVKKSGMNDYGKFLYLASSPKLENSSAFNDSCNRVESTTSILGCYNNGKIYIYNITDSQLDGIREVTATHETLHSAYVRLSYFEKKKVDALLEIEYKKLEGDKLFQEKMAFYDRTESGQRSNELHSVIATEISSISPELESYYSKYFSDRQAVVGLNDKYISVFKTLELKARNLKSQIDSLLSEIFDRSNKYGATLAELNNDINLFNNKADSNQFLSQSQFENERGALTSRIDLIDSEMRYINMKIDQYNLLLSEYNSIATQSQNLYNNLDSTLTAPNSI